MNLNGSSIPSTHQADSDPYDDRPYVKDLLYQHQSQIYAVQEILKSEEPLYEQDASSSNPRYDKLWILRYVLSHQRNIKTAARAAVKTIQFRDSKGLNALGDIRHRVPSLRNNQEVQFSSVLAYNTYCATDTAVVHTLPDKNRGVLSYVKVKDLDLKGVYENLPREQLQESYLFYNETVFQIQDAITRKTGRLTKTLKVIDLEGMTLKGLKLNFMKKDGHASKLAQEYYPQLVGAVYIINCPTWMSSAWKIISPLFPKRVVEKTYFFGKITSKKEKRLIWRFVEETNLPVRCGGSDSDWPNVDDLSVTFERS